MARKINIKKLYEKLNRELIEKSIFNIYKEKDSFFYSPKYQRNYVWDDKKAINLIETILINGEVPPITVIEANGKLEVIDGRQRIETILKFRNNEFQLKQFGLGKLKDLDRKDYDNLPVNVRTIFDEYQIKIILYTPTVAGNISSIELEYLKRNLFRKYNSGMTALTGRELARAKYLYDPLTIYISKKLEKDNNLLEDCSKILLPLSKRKGPIRERINDILVNVREMLTVTYIPIINLNTVRFGTKVIDQYYEKFVVPQDVKETTEEFFTIFSKLMELSLQMEKDKFPLLNNVLFMKGTYWMLSLVYRQYTKEFYEFDMTKYYYYVKNEGKGVEYFENNRNIRSDHIINRHKFVISYLEKYLNQELLHRINGYLVDIVKNKKKVSYKPKKLSKDEVWFGISEFEKLKTYSRKFTVQEILELMEKNRFIIRSGYQRNEVRNKIKASKIIESILLGIKLPPIYTTLETGDDNLDCYSTIDGQQRLLSIISYIGRTIINGNYGIIESNKKNYRLTGLKDLEGLNGYVFDENNLKINDPILKDYLLDDEKRNKILNYEIEVIVIDLKTNPKFSPVDMFIRMNQSPCNIIEDSFEMWNSYNIVNTLEYIKELANYDLFNQYGNRMKEEELVTILAYMDYKNIILETISPFFRVYQFIENKDKANERIEIKVSVDNKQVITHFLENLEPDSEEEKKFMKSVSSVEKFISKLKILTDHQSNQFIKLVNPYLDAPRKASRKDFYITWLILNNLDSHIVKTYSKEILKDLEGLFKFMKNIPVGKNENDFINYIDSIIKKYQK